MCSKQFEFALFNRKVLVLISELWSLPQGVVDNEIVFVQTCLGISPSKQMFSPLQSNRSLCFVHVCISTSNLKNG